MPRNLVNLFHCDADNVGDQMCGPAQYLWPTTFSNAPLRKGLGKNRQAVIVGGGQIFEQLRHIAEERASQNNATKLLAWGVGLPIRGSRDERVHRVAAQYELFSTRNHDWSDILPFVPCASCLSPIFDRKMQPQHEIVVYKHRRKPGPEDVPSSIPQFSNSMSSFVSAIEFIASGDTVVTSSYHGVYWAQLLGRRVVCLPYNHKFRTFEHTPCFAEAHTWKAALRRALRTHPLLEEYREKNRAFGKKAERFWNE